MNLSRRFVVLAAACTPAACSSPNPNLYVLAPVPGATRAGAPRVVTLRAIGLAHYLERSQIVRSSQDYRMDVLSNDWWGEPLDAMLSRILVQELNQRLPGCTVYSESGAIAMTPDASVEINVQRFDIDASGALALAAQVAIDGKTTASRSVDLKVRPTNATTPALVAAMSTATAQLADVVAALLVGR